MTSSATDTSALIEVTMPDGGDEAEVKAWRKRPGDSVSENEPICLVEVNGFQAELTSPADGTVARLLVGVMARVSTGQALAEIAPAVAAEPAVEEPEADEPAEEVAALEPTAEEPEASELEEPAPEAEEPATPELVPEPLNPAAVLDSGDSVPAEQDGALGETEVAPEPAPAAELPRELPAVESEPIAEHEPVADPEPQSSPVAEVPTPVAAEPEPQPLADAAEPDGTPQPESGKPDLSGVLPAPETLPDFEPLPQAEPPPAPEPESAPPPLAADLPNPLPVAAKRPEPAPVDMRTFRSPAVRRLAALHDVDLDAIEGSGRDGRVTKEDVEAAISQSAALGRLKRRKTGIESL